MPLKIEDTELQHNLDIALDDLASSKKQGKVGWFKNENYISGEGEKITETPVSYIASIQEFGDSYTGIPPRLGMRETAVKQGENWNNLAFNLAKQISEGKQTVETMLDIVSLKAAGDVREHITTVLDPPLSQKTIDARLSKLKNKKYVGNLTKPLIDSGILLNTLTSSVE